MTDHDLLIQVTIVALGLGDFGEKVLECIRDLGRGDLIAEAQELKAIMGATEDAITEPAPPAPEETPTDAP